MTSCGHNFCHQCIEECLNRKHVCPVCNKNTEPRNLVVNKHFDRLTAIVQQEKDKASKEYFEKLIGGANSNTDHISTTPTKLSPIEEIFHDQMKKSLLTYEDYYQKLKTKHLNEVASIRQEFADKMLLHQKSQGPAKKQLSLSRDAELSKTKVQCEAAVNEEEKNFEESIKLLLLSYRNFMENAAPVPEFLPVSVELSIPDKKISLSNIILKPTDTIKDLKNLIITKMEKLGDPISNWTRENMFVVSKTNTILEENVPVIQYGIDPGTLLVLQGKLHCASDAPKLCFKSIYVKDAGLKMDYFSCKDCGFNWICRSCSEVCHAGHNVGDHIHGQKPTWACCYCVKKGTCKLYH
eukprot:TRINITY_DN5098_c0_g1_i5.p1 TRINITY_DN5098_c0_g1~~TRINITY_DN5098_c0_g1_i5.p1  ORF type:complete len:352 (-),score=74.76 TRINITY_DN5098_c0_g1_i5:93-1148(-)